MAGTSRDNDRRRYVMIAAPTTRLSSHATAMPQMQQAKPLKF
jgi:hypothetical protein